MVHCGAHFCATIMRHPHVRWLVPGQSLWKEELMARAAALVPEEVQAPSGRKWEEFSGWSRGFNLGMGQFPLCALLAGSGHSVKITIFARGKSKSRKVHIPVDFCSKSRRVEKIEKFQKSNTF
jgi:hypothetical protein